MKNFQNQAKIIKVSQVIRQILFAGLVLWLIGMPVVLLSVFLKTPVVTGWDRLGLQGSFVLTMVFTFMVNLRLFRFFDRLRNGFLFDVLTVGQLDAAGKWLVVLWLFQVLYEKIRVSTLPSLDTGAFDSGSLSAGLILVFFAWLLKEAQKLQEEQALTV